MLGGDPRLILRNASSLTWIEGGKRLLFSEIKNGLHMGVVTTDEGRGQSRDVYLPAGDRSMAHHSYLSPDGKWVLVASQMDETASRVQCRVVPFDGGGREQLVGPAGATCTTGAWSPDGNWIYLSTNQGGRYHIWRQRFPEGEPEQVTSGPTEEEGIAMARDGTSFLTSVGTILDDMDSRRKGGAPDVVRGRRVRHDILKGWNEVVLLEEGGAERRSGVMEHGANDREERPRRTWIWDRPNF